jgi:hypothetical protein
MATASRPAAAIGRNRLMDLPARAGLISGSAGSCAPEIRLGGEGAETADGFAFRKDRAWMRFTSSAGSSSVLTWTGLSALLDRLTVPPLDLPDSHVESAFGPK